MDPRWGEVDLAGDDQMARQSTAPGSFKGAGGAFIVWTDLCAHVSHSGNHQGHRSRPILTGATGYADPGSITAIMGPSGSGKSTLLDALAGRLAPDVTLAGDIVRLNVGDHSTRNTSSANLSTSSHYNGTTSNAAAYVTQEDVLYGTLTVCESITYSASLRLPDTTTEEERQKIVDSAIQEMGLSGCQHTRVGSSFARGLSGGEKRRLSIALQTLTRPRLLFLDEPTSGLDSAAAYFVVQALRKLAKEGRTVISSIHQPSSEVFALFDRLTLLGSSGRTVFFGEAASASQFFAASSYPCPLMRNPSDHFLQTINADFDLVTTSLQKSTHDHGDVERVDSLRLLDHSERGHLDGAAEQAVEALSAAYQRSEYAEETRSEITKILSKPSHGKEQMSITDDDDHQGSKSKLVHDHASFLRQCRTLTKRSFVNMTRDPGYYWLRLIINTLNALALGTIFAHLDLQYDSIRERAGVLVFATGFLTYMSICGFPSFVEDMKVFQHERMNGHYGVVPFVVGNTVASIPFLLLIAASTSTLVYFMVGLRSGFVYYAFFFLTVFAAATCVESLMMAISSLVGRNFLLGIVLGAAIQAVYILVAGYYRSTKDIPKPVWRIPVSYISFYTYIAQGLFKNEFLGLMFENFLGADGKPIGPDLPGVVVMERVFETDLSYGKWGDLSTLFAMVAAYRILFVVLIKLSDSTMGPRLRAMAKALFVQNVKL